jgi:hypothetical protein
MAVQATIQTQGGLAATNAYLRISDLALKKIVGGDDNNKWQLTYGVNCYVNASARNSNPDVTLYVPTVDRFKIVSDTEPSDPINAAYANLKTQSTLSSVSDLV